MSSIQEQLDQVLQRVNRVELALYGEPNDNGRSSAVLPTMRRAAAYMDAACWVFKAAITAIPAAAAIIASGRSMGWW